MRLVVVTGLFSKVETNFEDGELIILKKLLLSTFTR